jgi:hypothetical protein
MKVVQLASMALLYVALSFYVNLLALGDSTPGDSGAAAPEAELPLREPLLRASQPASNPRYMPVCALCCAAWAGESGLGFRNWAVGTCVSQGYWVPGI